eukprot:163992_1
MFEHDIFNETPNTLTEEVAASLIACEMKAWFLKKTDLFLKKTDSALATTIKLKDTYSGLATGWGVCQQQRQQVFQLINPQQQPRNQQRKLRLVRPDQNFDQQLRRLSNLPEPPREEPNSGNANS